MNLITIWREYIKYIAKNNEFHVEETVVSVQTCDKPVKENSSLAALSKCTVKTSVMEILMYKILWQE